jgi:L-aspartate oxidase
LIIGGGLAGLFCALRLAPRPTTVLAAAPLGEGASSVWAQGGIAAAISEGDSPELHARDTALAGAGLVDEAMALGMAREAPDRVRDLLAYGAPFDRDAHGRLEQSREAAHSRRRIVRVGGDAAGRAIMRALVAAVRRTPSIEVREGVTAEAPIVRDGRFLGALARDDEGVLRAYTAAATVLAMGGAGGLYRVTTNPPQVVAAGLAIAAQAGALAADAEFMQFHPTAIDVGRDPAPLATEALRGEGAILVDRTGRRFMPEAHPDAELAPRDVVARAVAREIAAGRGAFLDARAAVGAEFPERFPTVYAACQAGGVDPVAAAIPIAPAAHYHMGGVLTDARGAASMPGLFAIGETASTGVHGANRLASNSLLEAVVFAARVAEDLQGLAEGAVEIGAPLDRRRPESEPELVASLRELMSSHVGVVRDEEGLAAAVRAFVKLEREAGSAMVKNMAISALVMAMAALSRQESRGAHARLDFPAEDAEQARRAAWRLEEIRLRAQRLD